MFRSKSEQKVADAGYDPGRLPSGEWLRGLELLDHDQPAFWERYGYHNDADYWKEERYSF